MFDGGGFGSGQLLANDAYLTLSFAADGVNVAGQANGLAAKFDSLPPQAGFTNWQDAILKAFQTWATLTNADIGVVPDGGQPFGSTGATRGDARFGDIRIAAISIDPAVGGEAIPVNQLVGGTWQADILFNTNFTYQSLSDVYAIALHEAGHVFGLGHSADPNSPMYGGAVLTAATPTTADIADLRALYGTRLPDFNEPSGATNNDSFATATDLAHSDEPGTLPGSVPSIAYGDITSNGDIDFFKFDLPSEYSGPINIEVRSTGISLLTPKLQVYSKQQQLLQEITSTSHGDTLSYTIPNGTSDKYYFAVSGATPDLLGLGGYCVKVTFPGVTQIDTSVLDQYGDRNLRKLTIEDIQKLLVPSLDDFVNEDNHADDDFDVSVRLTPESDFVEASRFATIGSISDTTDRDFYRIAPPSNLSAPANVLTVAIHTLSDGKLIPTIRVRDHHQNLLPATILANGGGELVVQISNVVSGNDYYIEVAANDPTGPFNTGNYELTASFGDQPANFTPFAAGTVAADGTQRTAPLYVAQPQLFHFLLQAGTAAVNAPTAVIAAIYNDADVLVYRLSTPVGQTQSQNAVLLAPGTYTVKISSLSLQGPVTVPITYTLSGIAISAPFASDPNDQTTHPFANHDPNYPNFLYLYPGPFGSNDPFLWTDFINSQNDPPPDLQSQVSLLLGSWWSWVWNQSGAHGPPLGQNDGFATPQDTMLDVAAGSGVLSNDIEPEGEPMVAALVTPPRVGTLHLNADGSFQYLPPVDFNGAVQFVYQASDFQQLSAPATVTLAVGMLGDYDHNDVVNQADYDVWRSNFGSTTVLDADGNGNGVIDQGDYIVWRRHLMPATSSGLPGDYDHNSTVNQNDYAVWRSNFGSTTVLDADGNGNSVVDAGDYLFWRRNLAAAASSASLAGAAAAITLGTATPAAAYTTAATAASPDSSPAATPTPQVNFTIFISSPPQLAVGSSFSGSAVPSSDRAPSPASNLLLLLDSPPATRTLSATDDAFSATAAATSSAFSGGNNVSLLALDLALANLWSTI